VGAIESRGELQEAALGERSVREAVGFVEHAADAGPHHLREMFEDVAALVDLAPLDDRRRATGLTDRLAETAPAIDDEEHRAFEIEAPVAQVGQEALAVLIYLGHTDEMGGFGEGRYPMIDGGGDSVVPDGRHNTTGDRNSHATLPPILAAAR
jgi:hypothetical protein